jgi:hypothetical protein
MPIVTVYHRPSAMDTIAAEVLKDIIRGDGMSRFSRIDLELSRGAFSFVFVEVDGYGELTHDIIVVINLHAFPERVDKADENAKEIAEILKKHFDLLIVNNKLTFGVALLHAEMGWGSIAAPQ